ncbi:MAG: hypothetical protein HGA19_14675 [Oscillochloris sp.]|nr:hypothetical protein [Oscillochloris sp.]
MNGTTTTQSSNAANQVVSFSYDAAGNLLSDGTTTSTYDALGRTITQGSTRYSSNGDGVLVAAGTIAYTQDLASPLSQILSNGSANYLYGRERLASSTGVWYLGDALGSVRQTLDASGAVTAVASYDPWGVPQGSAIAPFRFTGEVQDAQGQVYLRARWYTPQSGTFTSRPRDSFAGWPEQPYSLSYYQYGYSDPVLNTDPSGQCVPYPLNPFDPDCKFIGWNPTQWNWADGREYYYGPPGTVGKLALMALFPPAAFVYGGENAALSYIRYNDDPSTCNGVLVVVDTTLAVLPFGSLAKFGGGAGPMMQGGVQILTAAQSQLLRLEVAAVAVGAGYIPNVFFSKSGDGSGDPSGRGGNLKVPSDKFWKDRGIDRHEVKADYLGKNAELKLFDLAKDSDDIVWIVRKSRREGQFAPIKVAPLEEVIQIYGS